MERGARRDFLRDKLGRAFPNYKVLKYNHILVQILNLLQLLIMINVQSNKAGVKNKNSSSLLLYTVARDLKSDLNTIDLIHEHEYTSI